MCESKQESIPFTSHLYPPDRIYPVPTYSRTLRDAFLVATHTISWSIHNGVDAARVQTRYHFTDGKGNFEAPALAMVDATALFPAPDLSALSPFSDVPVTQTSKPIPLEPLVINYCRKHKAWALAADQKLALRKAP